MIKKGDILDRLKTLIGTELTNENLHLAVFSEAKHQKNLRRFHVGTHSYLKYTVHSHEESNNQAIADIIVLGNPYTYQVGVEVIEGKYIIRTEARISFLYI